jgi:hypothetical protein
MRSNLTRMCMCFVFNAWYHETCIWISSKSMNATISLKKTTDRIGTYQKSERIQETRRSLYHVKGTRHVRVHVNFEHSLSIQFGRKKRQKTFCKGMAQPPPFFWRMLYFSELCIYRLISWKFNFIGWLAAFSTYHSGQSLFGGFW